MFCAFHHLIVDVVSWRVIVSDLQRLHQGNRCRQRHQLPPMGRTVKAIRGNPARPMRLLAGDDRRQPDYATLSGVTQALNFAASSAMWR